MQDHATTPAKACSRCGVVKPLDQFYRRTKPTAATTHRAHCKQCTAAQDASRPAKQSRSIPRICKTCGIDFLAIASEVRSGGGIYCSPECYHANPPRHPIADRFWPKVDKNGSAPEHCPELGPCWVWTGAHVPWGYGQIGLTGRKNGRAHVVSWEMHNGPIPDGLWVLHKCDNPPCVRPDHLFLGTVQDNTADMIAKGRHNLSGLRNWRARHSE